MLESFSKRTFTAPLADGTSVSHDVYSKGESPGCVVILQELPGIGPETLSLADSFVHRGFRVVLPHLFGPLGRISLLGNMLRVMCLRREFALFEANKSSPIVDWLRALCADLKRQEDISGIGVIGMCLTGNFAISLMVEEGVLAGVASQPSMPLFKQQDLHLSASEIADAREALDEKGPMLAMRFVGDPLCRAEKYAAIDQAFNDDRTRIKLIEIPGKGHSVLTLDFIKGGEPAQAALDEVFAYFDAQLKTQVQSAG